MVGPRAKREAVRVVREEARLSERRVCGLIGMHRGSWWYRRKERNEAALRTRLRELAGERPRFGYRRLYIFLRREKTADGTLRWLVNHKRVYRLYREEGLAMRRKRRNKFRSEARVPLALPTRKAAFFIMYLVEAVLFWTFHGITSITLLAIVTFILVMCYEGAYGITPAFAADYFGPRDVGSISD